MQKIKVVKALVDATEYVDVLVSALASGAAIRDLEDTRTEATRHEGDEPYVAFADSNVASLYVITTTERPDNEFANLLLESGTLPDDKEGVLELLEAYYPDALAVGMFGNNDPFYWKLIDLVVVIG